MRKNPDGYALILALSAVVILGLLIFSLQMVSLSSVRTVSDEGQRTQSFYAAQSGLERVTRQLTNRAKTLAPSTAEAAATGLSTPASHLGDTGAGSFNVAIITVSVAGNDAVLRLLASGTTTAATRVISQDVKVTLIGGSAGAFPPTALIATGNIKDAGAAPVAGEKVPAGSHVFTCALTGTVPSGVSPCQVKAGGLNTYNVQTTSNPPPVAGQSLKDAAGNYYTVQKVTPVAGDPTRWNVSLAAMNENPTTTTVTQPMNTALLAGPVTLSNANTGAMAAPTGSTLTTNSNNTGTVCDPAVYGCSTYSFPPSALFQLIFGVPKTEFSARMQEQGSFYPKPEPTPEEFSGAACTDRSVVWLKSSDLDVPQECMGSLTSPKVLIVDASGFNGQVQVKVNNGVFYGLIYIISDNKVTLAGNGTYVGSVVSETGVETDPSNNDLSTVTGNGSSVCPALPGSNDKSVKVAKICYNREVVGRISTEVALQLSHYAVTRLPNSWQEHSR